MKTKKEQEMIISMYPDLTPTEIGERLGCSPQVVRYYLVKNGIKAQINRNRIAKTRMPEYGVWAGMKQRCSNPRRQYWHCYGGRGIRVCDKWADSFEAFLSDMGRRPSKNHQIDRIDPDGDYEPSNCRWVDNKTNSHNKRREVVTHCNNCGCPTNGRSWHGQCHACDTYERRTGRKR